MPATSAKPTAAGRSSGVGTQPDQRLIRPHQRAPYAARPLAADAARKRILSGALRGVWIVVACVSWGRPVLAAPMVVADPEVDVRSEPSETASVMRRLSAGFVVCPLPRGKTTTPPADVSATQGDAGTGDAPATQWIAFRLGAETGYLPATSVRSTNSESAVAICDPALALRSAVKSQPAEGLTGAVRRPAPPSTSRFLPVDPFRLTLGFAVGSATLRQDAADEHHIGRSGGSAYVVMGLVLGDLFSISTSLGAVIPPDGATFEQDVVPLLGPEKPMTATSSLEITNVSFAAGPRTPLFVVARQSEGAWVSALFAEGGWALITGNRFIADCRDCRQEGLGLPNGALVRVGCDFGYVWFDRWDTSVMFSVSYQHSFPPSGVTREIRGAIALWLF